MFACNEMVENEMELKGASPAGAAVERARGIDELMRRAYQIHRQQDGIFGYDLGDWLQAEKELAEEHNTFSALNSETVETNASN
jgi:hypothetical protein